jgi:nitrile hydratase accessory protein
MSRQTVDDVADVLDIDGRVAPPRRNGSLVFAEPWERRLFGVTMALYQAGLFEWEDFRQRLISVIERWEAAHPDGDGYRYYEHWLAALQHVLHDIGLVSGDEQEARVMALAVRPAGHDHEHGQGAHENHDY